MQVNTLILGAGAAGLFCAAHAGPNTLVIDHAKAAAEKIRISGGGRCNFTNLYIEPDRYLSENAHFCKSALARFTQWDFIDLVDRHRIPWHEKTLGQLFCDTSSKDIIKMLLDEVRRTGADLWLNTAVEGIRHSDGIYHVTLSRQGNTVHVQSRNLVLATGGKSIPKMGASGLAYDLAAQFGLRLTETRPALVPFTFSDNPYSGLSGVATPVRANAARGPSFDEALLFTHRGLSGPAMLQISSYWREGEDIALNLTPDTDLRTRLRDARHTDGRKSVATILARHLPFRFVEWLGQQIPLGENMADQSDRKIADISERLSHMTLRPTGTGGYRTAEVTAGGISTADLSSKTMEAKSVPGLFAIGEAVDVTGWLGGYNFQWAWSSAYAAGSTIRERSGG